jgi:hypothetical protein
MSEAKDKILLHLQNPEKVIKFLKTIWIIGPDDFPHALEDCLQAQDIQLPVDYQRKPPAGLQDIEFAIGYLEMALDSDMPEVFHVALLNVTEAHGITPCGPKNK